MSHLRLATIAGVVSVAALARVSSQQGPPPDRPLPAVC